MKRELLEISILAVEETIGQCDVVGIGTKGEGGVGRGDRSPLRSLINAYSIRSIELSAHCRVEQQRRLKKLREMNVLSMHRQRFNTCSDNATKDESKMPELHKFD